MSIVSKGNVSLEYNGYKTDVWVRQKNGVPEENELLEQPKTEVGPIWALEENKTCDRGRNRGKLFTR